MAGNWAPLPRDTVGKQLIHAANSIGANIAEGVGRGSFQDNRRFIRVARGSLNETQHWLRRAYKRGLLGDEMVCLLKPILDELAPRLNAYLRSIGPSQQRTTDKTMNPILLPLLTFGAVIAAVAGAYSILADLYLRDRSRVNERIDDEFRKQQRERRAGRSSSKASTRSPSTRPATRKGGRTCGGGSRRWSSSRAWT